MKWTRRIVVALLLAAIFLPLAAWLAFPWYAQLLVDRTLAGKPFHVQISGPGIPGPGGVAFRKLTASFTAPPDRCSSKPATWKLSLVNGRISWNIGALGALLFSDRLQTAFALDADSLRILPDPENFLFEDAHPRIAMQLTIARRRGAPMEFQPERVSYAIRNASVIREKLRLAGIDYRVSLSQAGKWQQQPDTLRVSKLYSDGNPSPLGNFRALFGSKRDPARPCTLILSNCSINLFEWNGAAERIEYDLREQQTSFTLRLAEIPLNELPWFKPAGKGPLRGAGRVRGSIPIEFRDSTVLVRNAVVAGDAGTSILYPVKENTRWFSLDIGPRKGSGELLKNLNATITLNSRNKNLSGLAVSDFSAELFDGKLQASPFMFDPAKNEVMLTLVLKDVRALDRLNYHSETRGSFKGGFSGAVPLAFGKKGLTFGQIDLTSGVSFSDIPLGDIPGLAGGSNSNTPLAAGTCSGTLPLEYRNSALTVRDGMISGSKGAKIILYDKENRQRLSFDLASNAGSRPLLRKINASLKIDSARGPLQQYALGKFSAETLGGTLLINPAVISSNKDIPLTITLKNINALDRVRLHGDFRGSLNGALSGTLPLVMGKRGLMINRARLRSGGGGTVTVAPPMPKRSVTERIFGAPDQDADYSFRSPDILFTRHFDGKTVIDFSLGELKRKTRGGEILLTSPKGTLALWQNRKNPDMATLSNFRAGFFDGTIAIGRTDFDMAKNETETVLQLNNIPLQKLLDLQGTKKVYATGTIKGSIPVKMSGQAIEIMDGAMSAESDGQIIYATTPEERALANQGLRTTYEALSNFLYIQLGSSISMAPDGKSVLAIRLKGNNPDFQGGRPVELNLNVEQNLLDLMRSLSISSNVEQIISEKALQKNK